MITDPPSGYSRRRWTACLGLNGFGKDLSLSGNNRDRMDERIRGEVSRLREEALGYEYLIVEDLYKSLGNKCPKLVEIGCGSLGLLGRKGDRLAALQAHSVGIDVDLEGLAANQHVTHRICATCYSLPLQSNSVDVIVTRWMFEHLEIPEQALREFSRVLKSGGFLYIKTPNLWNYVMMVSRMTPTAVHNFLRSATGGDNIPTFYRANTTTKLRELAAKSGFSVRRIESYSYSFMYYIFNKELFHVMRFLSKLMGKVTKGTHLMLCCVLEKVQEA